MPAGKLDLRAYFQGFTVPYCVIRMSEDFPHYEPGSDVDVLCWAVAPMVHYSRSYIVKQGLRAQVVEKGAHTHYDVYVGGAFHLRLDFIDRLSFSRFWAGSELADAVLDSRIEARGVYVPSPAYDVALRYLEYIEHPHKKKHLDYVLAHDGDDWIAVVERFTDLAIDRASFHLHPHSQDGGQQHPERVTTLYGGRARG